MVYDAWRYRKSHVATMPTGSLTNHPYQIIVMRTTGTSSEQTVYVGEKCKADFSDLRFTDSSSTELSYFISKKTDDMCIFWVKIPTVSSGSNTLYVYYGNPDATSESSGTDVFPLFFEAFDSFDGDVWAHSGTDTPTCSNSILTLTASCGDLSSVASFLGANVEYIVLATLGQWSGTKVGFTLTSNPAHGAGINTY
jgi:hypothetical protein